MSFLRALVPLLVLLAACADNSARFQLDPPASAAQRQARVSTVEVRDVSLPSYAAAQEIVSQQPDGALRDVPDSLWADDPVRGVTLALALALDDRSSATVAAEPWPLADPAQVRVDVRVERMLAAADGTFALAGQMALASPDGVLRERLERFDIRVPLTGTDPAAIADAGGRAISALADRIAQLLAR